MRVTDLTRALLADALEAQSLVAAILLSRCVWLAWRDG